MKPLKNAEEQLRQKLEQEGWVVTHKGFPDFACVKDDKMLFIEVKHYRGDRLKKEQHLMLTNMAKLGLDCFRWSPDMGFERITPSTPMPTLHEEPLKRKLTEDEKLARLSAKDKADLKRLKASGKIIYE